LQGQAELIRRFERLGGDLIQAAVAHAESIGRFHGWRPAMPVVQWTLEKPWPD
jgi:precorrin-6Y C5,15-methyltransferase (decarboxylating)